MNSRYNVVEYDEAIWCNILIRGAKLTVGVVELNAFISYRYAHDSRTNMQKNKRTNKTETSLVIDR